MSSVGSLDTFPYFSLHFLYLSFLAVFRCLDYFCIGMSSPPFFSIMRCPPLALLTPPGHVFLFLAPLSLFVVPCCFALPRSVLSFFALFRFVLSFAPLLFAGRMRNGTPSILLLGVVIPVPVSPFLRCFLFPHIFFLLSFESCPIPRKAPLPPRTHPRRSTDTRRDLP